jgi:glutamine amidotransferase
MIVVVDYGQANVGSVVNMLRKAGAPAVATADRKAIEASEKLILPGVGAFDSAMSRLRELDLVGVLNEVAVARRVPTLGICLGMQLLLEGRGGPAARAWLDQGPGPTLHGREHGAGPAGSAHGLERADPVQGQPAIRWRR